MSERELDLFNALAALANAAASRGIPVEAARAALARSGQPASGSQESARSDYPEAAALLCERFSRDFTTSPPKNEFEHGVQTATTRLAEAFRRQPEAPTAARRCQFCKGGASGSWCPTAEGCAAHGCHGECLPEDQEAPTAAALVRDAERYRFLRDNDKRHFWPPVHGSMWVVVYHQPPGLHVMPETRGAGYGADLDVAIDAAIAVARSGAGSEEGGQG